MQRIDLKSVRNEVYKALKEQTGKIKGKGKEKGANKRPSAWESPAKEEEDIDGESMEEEEAAASSPAPNTPSKVNKKPSISKSSFMTSPKPDIFELAGI